MSLNELYNIVYKECLNKLSNNIDNDEEKNILAKKIAIATIKYADLLPNRASDYIFDPIKFSDMNGKTGPYLLYNTVRIKSIFRKLGDFTYKKYSKITSVIERDIILHLMELPNVLKKAIKDKTLNEVCEYIFKLTNLYNSFYSDHYILNEENKDIKESWLVMSDLVLKTNELILNILAIDIPNKM